jgi:hypothetical protein
MDNYNIPVRTRGLGIVSLAFGILGGAFFWWTPLGMVFSITGLVIGFIGWTMARRMTAGSELSIAGMLVSLAALILDCVIAGFGLELIKLHALR